MPRKFKPRIPPHPQVKPAMLHLAFISHSLPGTPAHSLPSRSTCARRTPTAVLTSKPAQTAAVALSLPALPLTLYSEYVLFRTGCGLPPGPYGLLGAAEGISYLIVGALVLASIYSKVTTGKGLPEGPAKLLGAVEGVAFLVLVVGIGVGVYTTAVYGQLPEAVPSAGSRCFPSDA